MGSRDTPAERLRSAANELGFSLVGIAPATDADTFPHLERWLNSNQHGELAYMEKRREARRHPSSILESVRSVVMLGYEYGEGGSDLTPSPLGERVGVRGKAPPNSHNVSHTAGSSPSPPTPLPQGRGEKEAPSPPTPLPQGRGEKEAPSPPGARGERSPLTPNPSPPGAKGARVAKYAQAPDYHDWLWAKLNQLGQFLVELEPNAVYRGITDSAPLLERDFARRAGLGWFGKNTMLINKQRGSFFLLAALLTNIDLPIDAVHESSHCGTCTACLDACPTDAFVEPYVLDARRCISYLTIELRSQIPEEQRSGIGDWLFGCDICQDVCPWNRNAGLRQVPMPHDVSLAQLDPIQLLQLSPTEFKQRFKGTPLLRAKRAGLLRNAAIVLGNVGDVSALPALEEALNDDAELIRDAARWAIARIQNRLPDEDTAEKALLE